MGLILLLIILFFWWRRLLSGTPLPLFRRGPQHDIGDRYYSASIEGVTRPFARYVRPPQLAASFR